MTAIAGSILVEQVMPILASMIGRGAVKPVGCEDRQELVAEGCSLAAAMLDSAEAKGKIVAANSVAFYVIQALKAGRRSSGAGRQDALCPAAALDGNVVLGSLDAEFSTGEDDSDELTLHDVLASDSDGVDVEVARRLDWAVVDASLDRRSRAVLRETALGYGPAEIGNREGVTASRVVQIKRKAAEVIDGVWGEGQWREAIRSSVVVAGKRAASERRACRAERAA